MATATCTVTYNDVSFPTRLIGSKNPIFPDECKSPVVQQSEQNSLQCYIQSIPTELLLEIFSFAIDDVEYAPIEPSSMLWRLGQVCNQWRSVVSQCMPSTWASIHIPVDRKRVIPAISVCLRRALDSPLSVTLQCQRTTSLDNFKACLDLLVPECHRWQKAQLTLPLDTLDSFEDSVKGRLPLLEELSFFVIQPGFFRKVDPAHTVSAFEVTPRLQRVRTQLALDKIILPLSQLTSLETQGEIRDVPQLLELAPKLANLAAKKFACDSPVGFPSNSHGKNIYPVLTSLELSSGSEACFRQFSFPALQKLTIWSAERVDFEGLTSASHPALQHLYIGLMFAMRPDALFTLLRTTPSVSSLVLNASLYKKVNLPVIEELFDGLSGSRSDCLVPHLSELQFNQLHFPSEAELQKDMLASLVKLIQSRTCGSGADMLRKVHIQQYHPATIVSNLREALMPFVVDGMQVVFGEGEVLAVS